MSEWLTRRTNNAGKKHWFRTTDHGQTWEPVEPPADLPPSAAPAEAAPPAPAPEPAPTPAPVVTPPPPAPAPPAQQGPSLAGLVGSNLKLAGGKAADTLADLARGAGQGFTFGWGDELGASVASLLPDAKNDTGIPKTYAEGSSRDAMLAQMRRDNREAQKRSPTAYMAGEIAGTVPATTAAMLAAPAAAPVIAAGTAGLLGTGHAESSAPLELATTGSRDAALGALLASAGPAAGAVAEGAKAVKKWGRLGALTATAPQLETLAKKYGLDATMDNIADALERLGYTNRFIPQSVRTYYDKLLKGRQEMGAQYGDVLAKAGEEGVRIPKKEIYKNLAALRSEQQGKWANVPDPEGEVYTDMIKKLGPIYKRPGVDARGRLVPSTEAEPTLTPLEAHARKSEYEEAGGLVSDAIKGTPQAAGLQANLKAAGAVRKPFHEAMRTQASPETAQAFEPLNRDYGLNKVMENMARGGAVRQSLQKLEGATDVGNLGVGALLNGAPGAGLAWGLGKIGKTYASDAVGNLAALTEQGAGALSEALTPAAAQVASGPVEATAVDRWTKQSNGSDVVDGLRKAIERNPATLGPYARQLQEAHDKGDVEFRAAVNSLAQTDPKFRTQVLARIQ